MSKREMAIFALLLFSFIGSIVVTTAQDTAHPLITLSDNKLNFYGKERTPQLSRNLTIVGLAEEEVRVKLASAELYDNSSGKSISIAALESFNVTKNEEEIVTIILNTSRASAGTYRGAIIVTATTPENITTTKIMVTAKIEVEPTITSILYQLSPVLGTIAIITVVLGFLPEEWPLWCIKKGRFGLYSKKTWAVIAGMLAVSVWAYVLITSSFDTLTSILSTILIGPFIAYIIGYVNFKRDERKEKIKTATEIRNKGIEKDLEFLRGLLGETANHYASFRSKYYTEKGLLSRKKWDESSTQGMIVDIPTGRLAQYYRYTSLHNKYYECIMNQKLLGGKTAESVIEELAGKDLESVIKELDTQKKRQVPKNLELLCRFEKFRQTYSKLENIIFAYLIYHIGLLGETYLEPLKIEFPRISRGLLRYLVDNGFLIPSKYPFEDKKALKDAINTLDPRLFEKILANIYHPENRSVIKKVITEDFDETYKSLEELSDLPSLPPDCEKKEEKENKIAVRGSLTLKHGDVN